jgi:hypothetical protein
MPTRRSTPALLRLFYPGQSVPLDRPDRARVASRKPDHQQPLRAARVLRTETSEGMRS